MLDGVRNILSQVLDLYGDLFTVWIGLGLLFTLIAVVESQRCNLNHAWWRNPGLKTDIIYKLVDRIIGPYLQLPAVFLIYGLLCGVTTPEQAMAYFSQGIGPLSTWPFWAQTAAYLIIGDFILYWSHRLMHSRSFWSYHAAHHSATHVDWTTAYRSHPVNSILGSCFVTAVLIALGVPPAVIAFFLPWEIITAAYVHANLNWTHGRHGKYLLASPVFHRWHHGPANEGGSSNFAPTFPIWDVMFGTFHMPEGKLPQTFGVDDADYPESYLGQLIYPFVRKPPAPEAASARSR